MLTVMVTVKSAKQKYYMNGCYLVYSFTHRQIEISIAIVTDTVFFLKSELGV